MEKINKIALGQIIDNDEYVRYKINIGTDIFTFYSEYYVQGLLTVALWNNLNPYTFITNLRFGHIENWTNLNYSY